MKAGSRRFPTNVRLTSRIVAALIVAAIGFMVWDGYPEILLGAAVIGAYGLLFPRLLAWIMFPLAALWLIWALLYSGFALAGFVVGGVPMAVALLFFFSAKPRGHEGSESRVGT